ncbi:MAG: hypothetical protein IT303_00265 [Dehalococcoidia bacterium]|nr:hypothetical protein [Dehalococcoidia bacterium]
MHALTAAQMLDVWESAQGIDPTARPVAVLAAAGVPRAELASASIARRDAMLFELRRHAFGNDLRALVTCPACAEPLEFTAAASALAPDPARPGAPVVLEVGGLRVAIRPPATADLAAVRGAASVEAARDALLERCIAELLRAGEPIPFAALTPGERDAIAAAASDHPAFADPVLELECAACEAAWEAPFDIAAYFWDELRAFASRLLPEVHRIARAYGWPERDILALSPARRAAYLELIEGGV